MKPLTHEAFHTWMEKYGRASRWGFSTAVDPLGLTLTIMDDFAAAQRTMVARIPTRGIHTIYAQVGDLFAWLCGAVLTGTFAWVVPPLL